MKNVANFFYEVRSELTKVIWPGKDELIGSTIIVLFVLAFFSIYLWMFDFGISHIVKWLFKYFGVN